MAAAFVLVAALAPAALGLKANRQELLNISEQAPIFSPADDHILIFQYGKVGSSSLSSSLGALTRPPAPCTQVWFAQTTPFPRGVKTHMWWAAKDVLGKLVPGEHAWVVTGTRNQFVYDVSMYFERITDWYTQSQVERMTMKELQADFRARHRENGISRAGKFFREDFFYATGVNMTEYADTFRDGHVFVEREVDGKKLSIILVRFEEIEQWDSIIGRYFPGFEMGHATNVGSQKWYASLYKEFLSTYVFSPEEIQEITGRDTMRFYTDAEIASMTNAGRLALHWEGPRAYGPDGSDVETFNLAKKSRSVPPRASAAEQLAPEAVAGRRLVLADLQDIYADDETR